MDMTIEKVTQTNELLLNRYAIARGAEHDDSFLPGRDFGLTPDHPAYLLMDDQGVAGAAVLIRTKRYVEAGKGRLAILHSVLNTPEAYAMLLDALRPHFYGLGRVYLFLPQEKTATAAILAGLGFQIERYSFVLQREDGEVAEPAFPEGYAVRHLTRGDSQGIADFADCVNLAFRELAGHTESAPEDIRAWFDEAFYLDGGICLLTHNGEPVGTVCIGRETETPGAAEISALGLIPAQRGRGLGRAILRYATSFALQHRLTPVILSVNAENDKAVRLYESEGFVLVQSMVCYALACAG